MAETEANTSNESIDFVSKSNKKKRERERDFMEYVSEKVSAKGKDPLVNN